MQGLSHAGNEGGASGAAELCSSTTATSLRGMCSASIMQKLSAEQDNHPAEFSRKHCTPDHVSHMRQARQLPLRWRLQRRRDSATAQAESLRMRTPRGTPCRRCIAQQVGSTAAAKLSGSQVDVMCGCLPPVAVRTVCTPKHTRKPATRQYPQVWHQTMTTTSTGSILRRSRGGPPWITALPTWSRCVAW